LKTFTSANNTYVVPHQPADLVPGMIDYHELIHILRMTGSPLRELHLLMIFGVFWPQECGGAALGQDHRFQERIARQPIGSVQTGASHFADGKKPPQSRGAINICTNTSTLIMSGGNDRNRLDCDINPETQTALINVRKTLLNEVCRFPSDIEIHAGRTGTLHFCIDGPSDNVAGRQSPQTM